MNDYDEIAAYLKTGLNLQLPLRKSPINFAVTRKNGLTSNAWGIRVKGGDAYIYCRDNMKEIKISLHKSGKQFIAFRKESGHEMTPGSRFLNQWWEPSRQTPPVPSFKLVFPSWGVGLSDQDRQKVRSKWDKNRILVEGDDRLLTTVSFFILDEGLKPRQEGLPSVLLGVLPLKPGKNLCVVACQEYERNLRSLVEKRLKKIEVRGQVNKIEDEVLSLLLTADEKEGYAYMVVVPVKIHTAMAGNDSKV